MVVTWPRRVLPVLILGLLTAAFRPATASGNEIYLINLGWHAGIAVPVNQATRSALPVEVMFDSARYLEFGWGDADYYRDPDPSLAAALEAALLPGPAVLHVRALPDPAVEPVSALEILPSRSARADSTPCCST